MSSLNIELNITYEVDKTEQEKEDIFEEIYNLIDDAEVESSIIYTVDQECKKGFGVIIYLILYMDKITNLMCETIADELTALFEIYKCKVRLVLNTTK